jgi:NitT/TauT family transport system ATP-binding protein
MLHGGTEQSPGRSNGRDRAFITVDSVSLTYVGLDRRPKEALAGVSLDIAPGQFVSLVGPSGCGKTTLLQVLAGLLSPSAGAVAIDRESPATLRKRHEIGYIFQESTLLPWKTVRKNVAFLREVAGKPRDASHIVELARLVGIEEALDRYPHELSGGMQQRAAIARALALDPKILLMDEPFGALDEIRRHQMNEELLRIWAESRKTVVFVTHSLEEAAFLSDSVFVMAANPGRTIARIPISLPRPRTAEMRYTGAMTDVVATLHRTLRNGIADSGGSADPVGSSADL